MKIRSRWLSKIAAWGLVTGFRLLMATCRKIELAPSEALKLGAPEAAASEDDLILCAWHDALIIPTFVSSTALRRRTCCLVSQHQDGSYLADSMALLGYSTVRGSSSRGGAAAIRQLMDDTAGKHIVITPDGPRGPRRELKVGPIYLASQTGRKICCGAYVCRSGWRIKGSWTDMLIPKPFTTVYCLTSEPIAVPPDLSREQLHEYVARIQGEMNRLDEEANRAAGGKASTQTSIPQQRAA